MNWRRKMWMGVFPRYGDGDGEDKENTEEMGKKKEVECLGRRW